MAYCYLFTYSLRNWGNRMAYKDKCANQFQSIRLFYWSKHVLAFGTSATVNFSKCNIQTIINGCAFTRCILDELIWLMTIDLIYSITSFGSVMFDYTQQHVGCPVQKWWNSYFIRALLGKSVYVFADAGYVLICITETRLISRGRHALKNMLLLIIFKLSTWHNDWWA